MTNLRARLSQGRECQFIIQLQRKCTISLLFYQHNGIIPITSIEHRCFLETLLHFCHIYSSASLVNVILKKQLQILASCSLLLLPVCAVQSSQQLLFQRVSTERTKSLMKTSMGKGHKPIQESPPHLLTFLML